jgi:hypothetical protein
MKKNIGWTCPNCGRGVAPTREFCDCVPKQAFLPPVRPYPYYPNYYPWGWYPNTWTVTTGSTSTSAPTRLDNSSSNFTIAPTEVEVRIDEADTNGVWFGSSILNNSTTPNWGRM